eukprot:10015-Pleurochrysis_carterae.AAC.2
MAADPVMHFCVNLCICREPPSPYVFKYFAATQRPFSLLASSRACGHRSEPDARSHVQGAIAFDLLLTEV